MGKFNAAYVEFCNKWVVKGCFPAFLARFRAYIIEDYLPLVEKEDLMVREQLEIFGIEAKDYRSTEPMKVVREYMNYASSIFGMRMKAPMRWP